MGMPNIQNQFHEQLEDGREDFLETPTLARMQGLFAI